LDDPTHHPRWPPWPLIGIDILIINYRTTTESLGKMETNLELIVLIGPTFKSVSANATCHPRRLQRMSEAFKYSLIQPLGLIEPKLEGIVLVWNLYKMGQLTQIKKFSKFVG